MTDGENDGGIDAVYLDSPHSRLLIVQSKFKRSGAGPSQEENLKTINGIRKLLARRFADFNDQFQSRLDDIETALDTPGMQIEIHHVFLGQNISPHVESDLNELIDERNTFGPSASWQWHGLLAIHQWLVQEQVVPNITTTVTLENWASVTTPRKAVYGQISAALLARLVQEHGNALFERNIRHYLGSEGVNAAISKTLTQSPQDLFYLNNGLTAVADRIEQAAGNPSRCNFRLVNVSIVNGAQTAGTVSAATADGPISPEAKLLITIVETGGAVNNLSRDVTRARNYQNVVRGVDFAALDPQQERLRRELATVGITYHYRPSKEARARTADSFTIDEAALALACFALPPLNSDDVRRLTTLGRKVANAVDLVVTAKKEIGRLTDPDGDPYKMIFHQQLTGIAVSRWVTLYRFIDQILADTERSEANHYHRHMFFRHGRYFLMAIVAHSERDLFDRPELLLSAGDKTRCSRATNEVAELVYNESLTFQGNRGYKAVFANLTDAQPLADKVLQALTLRAGR